MCWFICSNIKIFWIVGEGICLFFFSGIWYSSNYDSMVFFSFGFYIFGLMFIGILIVGSGWECYLNFGNRYVVKYGNLK